MSYIVVCFFIISTSQVTYAEQYSNNSTESNYSVFESFVTLFPPFLFQNIIQLKSYVRSDEFSNYKKQNGDLLAVDEIFNYSIKLTRGNTGIALLLCTVATLDHYTLGIRIPVFNIYIPLSNETSQQFKIRVNNLPSQIYVNNPQPHANGKDKLQHFFGSAFIVYVFESSEVAERFSEFVEKGEDRYIKGGQYDNNDIEANRDGQLFGIELGKNQKTKPSDILSSK